MVLLDWSISQMHLEGFAIDHPTYGNSIITSNVITGLSCFDDHFEVYTYAGSKYALFFDRVKSSSKYGILKLLRSLGVSEKVMENFKNTKEYITSIKLEDGDLYIEVSCSGIINAYYKKNDKLFKADISSHIEYDDIYSVLFASTEVDMLFKYYDSPTEIKYRSSENVKRLVYNNLSEYSTTFSLEVPKMVKEIKPTGITYIVIDELGREKEDVYN